MDNPECCGRQMVFQVVLHAGWAGRIEGERQFARGFLLILILPTNRKRLGLGLRLRLRPVGEENGMHPPACWRLSAAGGWRYTGQRSPGMRKWLKRCAVAAALILIVLLALVSQSHPPGIWVGKPLPTGKVQPQLAIGIDTAVMLAPDGSLWLWGGTDYGV